jgi:hypothetical protein
LIITAVGFPVLMSAAEGGVGVGKLIGESPRDPITSFENNPCNNGVLK